MTGKLAIVVLSGGQDSTTCLYWAKQHYHKVHAITFDYGQRHRIEIEAAKAVALRAGLEPVPPFALSRTLQLIRNDKVAGTHEIVNIRDTLVGTSPLVSELSPVQHYNDVASLPGGIEATFVPARNMLFMTIAANRAVALAAESVVLGLCQADYGGYPDCRESFVRAMQCAVEKALLDRDPKPNEPFVFETPLMNLTKAQSAALAHDLPGCLEALAYSHTCYDGLYPPNPHNHASLLRAKGFSEAGIPDPLIVRAKSEGRLPEDYPDSGLVEGTKYA